MQTDPEDTKAQGDSQTENEEKKADAEEMEVGFLQTANDTTNHCKRHLLITLANKWYFFEFCI